MVNQQIHTSWIITLLSLLLLDSKGGSLLFGLDDLAGSYDSIVWHVKGLEGRLRIFNNEGTKISLTSSWGHCFYLPGSYEAYLSGYKGKQIIQSDTLHMELTRGPFQTSYPTSLLAYKQSKDHSAKKARTCIG